jgi:hypothetical protein
MLYTVHMNAQSKVGINEPNPQATLDVKGSMRIQSVNAAAGKVLTSDSAGFATWQLPTGGSGGSDTNWYRNLQNQIVANGKHVLIGTNFNAAPFAVYSDTIPTVANIIYEGNAYADKGILKVGQYNGTVQDHVAIGTYVNPGDDGGFGIGVRSYAGYAGAYLTSVSNQSAWYNYGVYSEAKSAFDCIGNGAYAFNIDGSAGPFVGNKIGIDVYAANGAKNIGIDAYGQSSVTTDSAFGIKATALGGGYNVGLLASASGVNSKAARFIGNVDVVGNLSKSGGTFKIDHPQDPANKYLVHSFVESPDMMNVYNGNIITKSNGEAVVELPSYFEAENKDFRYQLTVIGKDARVYVASKIINNKFSIKTSEPNAEVSWQVTGVRNDAWANANRVVPEVNKLENEQGKYLHPELFESKASLNPIVIKAKPNMEANLKSKNAKK